jgi:beta-phosphoglucomutase-like phosphatase (HAD superfamily)
VGLGIPFEERHSVVGIEDSSAGVVSIRLAGFTAFGLGGGNISEGGAAPLCHTFSNDFEGILKAIQSL